MELWDYGFAIIREDGKGVRQGDVEFQKALVEGYQPYAVTHWVEAPAKSPLTSIQPTPVMVEKHHLRRKQLVKTGTVPITPETV